MAYQTGDVILRDHYNTFATGNADGTANNAVANINTIWGVGSGDKGYGQSTTLSAVNAGDVVTATQWSTLLSRLNSILTHQAGSGSGITNPTAGATVTALTTISTNITNATTNRANFNSTRGTPTTTSLSGTWNSASPTTFQQVRTVTFASSDQARYFFNAGGRIALSFAVTNGADNAKETAWTALLGTKLATLNFDFTTSSRTGTGGTLTTDGSAIGFWDLTTSDQTLIRLTDTTAAYTTNYVEVLARISGAAGSNGGLGNVITFTINYNDAAADPGAANAINMIINANVVVTPPETTNLTNTWGSVTAASGGDTAAAASTFSISPAVSGKTSWNMATDGALSLPSGTYTITPTANYNMNVKMWGAGGGGGGNWSGASGGAGGAGGYASGIIALTASTAYTFSVGAGGVTPGEYVTAGDGGGLTAIKQGSTWILVAGSGGGGGGSNQANGGAGGAGGGTNGLAGSNGRESTAGGGGTQSAGGSAGSGTSSGGVGTQGAGGAGGGATGFSARTGGGSGGAGYWGGGGAGGTGRLDEDPTSSGGGGGGSGYYNSSLVTSATLTAGSGTTPGNSGDSARGSAGAGGAGGTAGSAGTIYIY